MHALNTKFTIIPTYFAYEVSKYQVLPKKDDGAPTFIRIEACKRIDIPYFLEAPARFLSAQLSSAKESFKLYQAIKQSPIYDTQLKIYKTSESLEHQSLEIGRIRAFTPGWLERESAFLHMTYKYQLGLLKANLYDEFFATMREGMTCFMDPLVYGRSPLENSSFIATSNNPDLSKHGQGFFARLSGSTAEVLSMWKRMMFGENLFSMKDGQLRFTIKPILPKAFFRDGKVETLLFSKTNIIIHYQGPRSTYDASVSVSHYELIAFTNHAPLRVEGPHIQGSLAEAIRQKQYAIVHVYLKGGTH
jgi:hypothetical protein